MVTRIGLKSAKPSAASRVMVNRQRLTLDKGSSRMLELCYAAQRPDGYQILQDPINDDLIFCFQFKNHAPVAFRTEIGLALENMASTMRYLRSVAN